MLIDARRYAPAGRPAGTSTVRTPFTAAAFSPLKNANLVGSVGVVVLRLGICSITTCEWPLMLPEDESTCWGAEKKFSAALTKKPVSRFLTAIWIVKSVFALIVAPFGGKTNLDEGMCVVAAMTPIGAGLHDPVVIWVPFVSGRLGTVAQKLMKLFEDVSEGTWPAAGMSCPLFSNPVATRDERRVSEV